MCDPILVTLSQSSRENATPSSGAHISIQPRPQGFSLKGKSPGDEVDLH